MCDVVLLPPSRGRLLRVWPNSRYSPLLLIDIVLAISGIMLASNCWYLRYRRNRRIIKRTITVAFTRQPPRLRVVSVLKLAVAIYFFCAVSRNHAVAVHNTVNITYMLMCQRK